MAGCLEDATEPEPDLAIIPDSTSRSDTLTGGALDERCWPRLALRCPQRVLCMGLTDRPLLCSGTVDMRYLCESECVKSQYLEGS
jgi:hypothetical protein